MARILFTGASSFSGYWFVTELARLGHEVFFTLTRSGADEYAGLRHKRVKQLLSTDHAVPLWNANIGTPDFLQQLTELGTIDVFCHHASNVTDHKSKTFDVVQAFQDNIHGVPAVLGQLQKQECKALVYSSTYYEPDTGEGSLPMQAFSPYALSKNLSYQWLRYYTQEAGVRLGRFVMPNPFGPLEDKGLARYLLSNWKEGGIPEIQTPEYVRDNIPIGLLAKSYALFLRDIESGTAVFQEFLPSGYVESNSDFVSRLAQSVRERTGKECTFLLNKQSDFSEPHDRHNTLPAASAIRDWNESAWWDAYIRYGFSEPAAAAGTMGDSDC